MPQQQCADTELLITVLWCTNPDYSQDYPIASKIVWLLLRVSPNIERIWYVIFLGRSRGAETSLIAQKLFQILNA